MTPAQFRDRVLLPGAAWTEEYCGTSSSPEALRFLLAVAGQEADWRHRFQVSTGLTVGPARGFWQFEKGGGVKGVMTHQASKSRALVLCEAAGVTFTQDAVWRALEGHDFLAYGFARLLLLTDPFAVPTAPEAAWDCYAKRLWRPGAPHPAKWTGCWTQAKAALLAGADTA